MYAVTEHPWGRLEKNVEQPAHPNLCVKKCMENTWKGYTAEQENFATGNSREFGPQEICVQEMFANFWIVEVFNIRVQEIFVKSTDS